MYGVIDIGSNTVRLMIYKIENNEIKPMLNKKYSAGLANYINKKNCMSKKGIETVVDILSEFKQITENIGIDTVFPFATASLRNIANTDEVLSSIKEKCGMEVQILTGHQEAVFDYYGAIMSTDIKTGLLVDIGGGSTELVFFSNKEMLLAESLPIGSLNMYRKYVEGIIPTTKETQKIEKEVIKQLNNVLTPSESNMIDSICGVGGTARSTLKLHNYNLSKTKQTDFYESEYLSQLLHMLSDEDGNKKLISNILKIAPERIHTLIPGMVILHTISAHYGIDVIATSPYGVREGYLYRTLEEQGVING